MRKAFIEHALQGELTHLFGYEKHAVAGRKSGASRKTIKTEDSTVEIAVPRDRNGKFEPQLIGKHERRFRRMKLASIMAKRVQ